MPVSGVGYGVKSVSIGGKSAVIVVDEVSPALAALKAQLRNLDPILEELSWMVIEHVHDRFRGQGRSRKFGGGPQPKWSPIHDVTRKFRSRRHGVTDDIIWSETGAAFRGVSVISRTTHKRVIGWGQGKFKNDYPYILDGGGERIAVKKTKGMIPGRRIYARPVLYFTSAFANKWATQAIWRWWLSPIGVKVY